MRLESGWSGLTRQLIESGEQVRVVARDGTSFDIADWARSGTFWQAGQEQLLVGDNQTGRYIAADADERARLTEMAWRQPRVG